MDEICGVCALLLYFVADSNSRQVGFGWQELFRMRSVGNDLEEPDVSGQHQFLVQKHRNFEEPGIDRGLTAENSDSPKIGIPFLHLPDEMLNLGNGHRSVAGDVCGVQLAECIASDTRPIAVKIYRQLQRLVEPYLISVSWRTFPIHSRSPTFGLR